MEINKQRSTVRSSASEAIIDQGLRSYMLKVYNYMASALVLTGFIFGKDIIYGLELFVFSSKLRFDFILSSLSFIGAIYVKYFLLSESEIGFASGSFCFNGSTCLPFFQNL